MDILGYDFQTRLLLLMLVNREFLAGYRSAMSPDLFDAEEHQQVASVILEYYDKYHEPPDWVNLKHYLLQSYPTPPHGVKGWGSYVKGLSRIRANGNLAYVHDQAETLIRHRRLGAHLMSAVKAWERLDLDGAVSAFRQYEKLNISPSDGINFTDDFLSRLTKPDLRDPIPIGIRVLDDCIGGGPARSELTVIMAPPGRGKTTFMINVGVGAVLRGKKVYHLFAEGKEDFVWLRYAQRFAKKPVSYIKSHPRHYSKKIPELIKAAGGELRIANCLHWKVSEIRSYIYRHGVPDVLIIDYADKLSASARYDERRHEVSYIYEELVALAKEFDIVVHTGSQSNRAAFKKTKMDLNDAAEAWGKCEISDNILALCQTDEEEDAGQCRIFTAKVRNVEGMHRTVHLRISRSKMMIWGDPANGAAFHSSNGNKEAAAKGLIQERVNKLKRKKQQDVS